ncbi:iron ABC transporter substrate-binding protein [Candidatus Mycoplasma haematobovis]|uniref:Iron ABC transporter substrate-binding protein n=1 Tax=Candidatus Mycoplasma haematobovis TaxID=432608 RepID=A0A1A9QDA1_9MOLU|nr:iron ABC transporter substrate-binding protein [Candidatus Mycoplasma haematobovis]OAL10443.1 iron ABC transporter substrate-binding protein [Candidatus Mycoplasma haematobovis]
MLNKKVIVASAFPCLSGIGFLGSNPTNVHYKIMVNYNGQADLLLSLQIFPDYYPYQFKKTTLYDYLTNVNDYLVVNEHTSPEKKKLKEGLQKRLDDLLGNVKEFGPSLWNEDLYETGLVFKNDQQWSNRSTSILFLEQFIADDFVDINESTNSLPAYKDLIITNYRAARDPYTIFSKNVFNCFKEDMQKTSSSDDETCKKDQDQDQKIATEFKKYIAKYDKESINSLYRFGKYIGFWNDLFTKTGDRLNRLEIEKWIKNKNLFALDITKDKQLAEKYARTIFTKEERDTLNSWIEDTPPPPKTWQAAYISSIQQASAPVLVPSSSIKLVHHPALEQQTLPGSAPLAEGSQKEVIVFLFQFAALIDEYVKRSGKNNFATDFVNDPRKEFMQNALKNAQAMAKNLEDRTTAIRDYFKKIEVVDSDFEPAKLRQSSQSINNSKSKAFAIVTYPPSSFGAGEATIQSMSKFPFLYTDIGLKQVLPKNLDKDLSHKHEDGEISLEDEIFSVDDNGWWWKIGNVNLDSSNLFQFENQADSLLVLANPEDWNLINDKNAVTLKSLGTLLKSKETIDASKIGSNGYPVSYNKYHLWNEGLRSPIALNLLLDNLVDIFQRQYDPDFKNSKDNNNCYKKAMDWGNYWHEAFINNKSCRDSNGGSTASTIQCN